MLRLKEVNYMQVKVEIDEAIIEPYAIIYTNEINEDIKDVVNYFNKKDVPLCVLKNERIVILKPEDIFMIRIEGGKTMIYTYDASYQSKKRLYEIYQSVGKDFMQISKQTVINLSYLRSVEASLSGTLLIKLKNKQSDYVSRKYLPAFKKYLGL